MSPPVSGRRQSGGCSSSAAMRLRTRRGCWSRVARAADGVLPLLRRAIVREQMAEYDLVRHLRLPALCGGVAQFPWWLVIVDSPSHDLRALPFVGFSIHPGIALRICRDAQFPCADARSCQRCPSTRVVHRGVKMLRDAKIRSPRMATEIASVLPVTPNLS